MPVHAVVVTRPNAGSPDALEATLAALRKQTRAPGRITVIARGKLVAGVAETVDAVVEVSPTTRFAEAIATVAADATTEHLWLLNDSVSPDPEALHELTAAFERAPSAAIAVGKLVRRSGQEDTLLSFGETMTTLGRAVNDASGEIDQGQYDDRDEALGFEVIGALVRAEHVNALLPDPALLGADEGLDMGVRARLAGGRVVLARNARVRVRGAGAPELSAVTGSETASLAYRARTAQLHRRLSYAPLLMTVLHWLSMPFLAVGRSIWQLIEKKPSLVWPELAAAAVAMGRPHLVARSRRNIRGTRLASRRQAWGAVEPFRVTPGQARQRIVEGQLTPVDADHDVDYLAKGGAWVTLAAIVAGIAAFISLLAWPAISGGALLPLSERVSTLWQNSMYGQRDVGSNLVGPADPFAGVLAAIGTLSPGNTSYALILLWVLALPLAATGAWFAATRLTGNAGVRAFVAVAWAFAPTFLTALMQARPHAVIAHILLAWLVHAAAVAYRSWGAAGASSLLLLATVAAAPSLAVPLFVGWIVLLAANMVSAARVGSSDPQLEWPQRLGRLVWLWVPTVVAFAPLAWWHLRRGTPMSLLVDPGKAWQGPGVASDVAGRLQLAIGLPDGNLGAWLGQQPGVWALVLLVPLAALALTATLTKRWRLAIVFLAAALLGVFTAWLQQDVALNFDGATPVSIWAGTGVSLAWFGFVAAAALALEALPKRAWTRSIATAVAIAALAVFALPQLTSVHRGDAIVARGDASTLPALVAASAGSNDDVGTLILSPNADGGFTVDVAWGASETLDAQATMSSTAQAFVGDDLSQLVGDLLSTAESDVVANLGQKAIGFVLLAPDAPNATTQARDARLAAAAALDQRVGLLRAGETDKGGLWPLEAGAGPRPELTAAQQTRSVLHTGVLLAALVAAVLLSVPTAASRRLARAYGRPGAAVVEQTERRGGFAYGAVKSAQWLAGASVSGGLVVAVLVASALPEPTITAQAPSTLVTPGAQASTLVCTDSFRVYGRNSASPSEAAAAGVFAITRGGAAQALEAAEITSPDLPGAASALHVPAGTSLAGATQLLTLNDADVAGFAASSCGTPRSESWIVGGSALVGASDVLLLTNPNPVPATADISVYLAEPGIADIVSQRVVIAAESQRALPLSSLVVGQRAPVVKVVSSGAPIDVQLQSTQMSVLVPAGIEQQISSQLPTASLAIVGVQLVDDSSENATLGRLRLLAPENDANVTVTMRAAGAASDTGESISTLVPAGAPVELDLNAPAGIYEIRVKADAPIVAAAWQTTATSAPSDFAWVASAPILDSEALVVVPAVDTSIPAQLHVSSVARNTATVTLENTTTGAVETIDLEAGVSQAHSLAPGAYRITASEPIYAAVAMHGPNALAGWPIESPAHAADAITIYQ